MGTERGWARSTCCWIAILQLSCPSNGYSNDLTHPGCDTDEHPHCFSPHTPPFSLVNHWATQSPYLYTLWLYLFPASQRFLAALSSLGSVCTVGCTCDKFWCVWSRQADYCWSYWHHCRYLSGWTLRQWRCLQHLLYPSIQLRAELWDVPWRSFYRCVPITSAPWWGNISTVLSLTPPFVSNCSNTWGIKDTFLPWASPRGCNPEC